MNTEEHRDPGSLVPVELQRNQADRLAALGRSVANILPFVGGAVAEVLTATIPRQREERIVGFLAALDERLRDMEKEFIENRLRDPEGVDLLEDGLYQAARVLTEERRNQLAALLKNGLTETDLDHLQKKKLLSIFGELNDAEVVILKSYLREHRQDAEFLKEHREVLYGPQAYIGSSADEIDRAAVHGTYRQHLTDLGLLRKRFKRPRRGDLPEFDEKTGMIKSSGFELTRLGGLLLRYLDLTDQDF